MRVARFAIASVLLAATCCFAKPTTMPSTRESASESSDDAGAASTLVYRTYDVSDLLRPAKDYPLPSANAGGSGGEVPAKPNVASATPEGMKALIESFVAPESWKDNGGMIGAIDPVPSRDALVVQQTQENQAHISELLKSLREESGIRRMISVRASWVTMDPREIDKLYKFEAGRTAYMPAIDDALLAKTKLYSQAQNTCFNGQTVSIQSGREWSYVSDVTPIVGTNSVGYDPEIRQADTGVTLQVTPQLTPDDDTVVLDVHSTVKETTLAGGIGGVAPQPTTRPAEGQPSTDAIFALMQRPNLVSQSFATTVRIPLGKRVIIGGMTLPPEAGGSESRNLYLLVQADAVR